MRSRRDMSGRLRNPVFVEEPIIVLTPLLLIMHRPAPGRVVIPVQCIRKLSRINRGAAQNAA